MTGPDFWDEFTKPQVTLSATKRLVTISIKFKAFQSPILTLKPSLKHAAEIRKSAKTVRNRRQKDKGNNNGDIHRRFIYIRTRSQCVPRLSRTYSEGVGECTRFEVDQAEYDKRESDTSN
ncbi:hypothetical protein EDB83DRAFT_2319320 [Lactarius deliciosus]|nr:hypothetical protein EDB83DRAFT_2319320 [Lactarius deliciosus]